MDENSASYKMMQVLEKKDDEFRYEEKMHGRPHYWNLTAGQNFKAQFQTIFAEQKLERVGDAFYYPQVLFAAILLGFISVLFFFYTNLAAVFKIQDA